MRYFPNYKTNTSINEKRIWHIYTMPSSEVTHFLNILRFIQSAGASNLCTFPVGSKLFERACLKKNINVKNRSGSKLTEDFISFKMRTKIFKNRNFRHIRKLMKFRVNLGHTFLRTGQFFNNLSKLLQVNNRINISKK